MLRMMKKETLYQRVFFVDFNIDMIDVDEDFIEKEVLEEASDDISMLLTGCSYDDKILSRIKEEVKLKKSYNSIVFNL